MLWMNAADVTMFAVTFQLQIFPKIGCGLLFKVLDFFFFNMENWLWFLQMRLNKVSELIHNSTNHQNLDSAGVSVHFQEIVDLVVLIII